VTKRKASGEKEHRFLNINERSPLIAHDEEVQTAQRHRIRWRLPRTLVPHHPRSTPRILSPATEFEAGEASDEEGYVDDQLAPPDKGDLL